MSLKAILAPLTGQEASETSLVAALKLARRHGATLDVLHVSPDPRDAIPLVTEGAAGVAVANIIEAVEADSKKRAARAKQLFQAACKQARAVTTGPAALARFETIVGRAAGELSVRARTYDLLVFGRVPAEFEGDWRMGFEAALMEGGRPVLLLPSEPDEAVGRSIAVAWNGSMEAARAASAALPLLAKAKNVLLLAGLHDEPVTPPLTEVAKWLRRHGIRAATKQIKLKGGSVGDEIAAAAAKAGADLLVTGGYGHSRVRETLFGGATRSFIEESDLAVLMAH